MPNLPSKPETSLAHIEPGIKAYFDLSLVELAFAASGFGLQDEVDTAVDIATNPASLAKDKLGAMNHLRRLRLDARREQTTDIVRETVREEDGVRITEKMSTKVLTERLRRHNETPRSTEVEKVREGYSPPLSIPPATDSSEKVEEESDEVNS